MEREPTGEMTLSQFREELNEWFRERGILDNLRSHLRTLMIAALQRRDLNLKCRRKTCPKIQSIDLVVAEYLLARGCHYAFSVLTSELPSLANFGTGAVFIGSAKNKPGSDPRFQEKEVSEILNCLRLFCDDPGSVWSRYDDKKGEESLLECLLGLLASLGSDQNPKGAGGEEENFRRRAKDLAEREKRIQECLRSHEEEVLMRLKMAEKDLDDRRESIEKELTERQMDLRRIAFHWRNKHNEIMSLSKLFAAVKNENKALREKLDAAEEELNRLKSEMEVKTEALERARDENLKFKSRLEEYLKWKNKTVEDESHGSMVCPKMSISDGKYLPGVWKNVTEANSNAEENSSSSEILSLTEDALLEKVKARVRVLEEETGKINEKYLTSKKKYDDDLSFESEITDCVENSSSKTSDVPKVVNPEEDKPTPKKESDRSLVITEDEPLIEVGSNKKKKQTTEKKEEEMLVPTKRQEQNREYYLKSRHLLEILEKNTGMGVYPSLSSPETSVHCSCSSESSNVVKIGEQVPVRVSEDSEDINASECLNLLKEATYRE